MRNLAPIRQLDANPVQRLLDLRGLGHRTPNVRLGWHGLWNANPPCANPHAWIHGGAGQLTLTAGTGSIGTTRYDPRAARVVTARQHRLAYGAPQMPAFTNLFKYSRDHEVTESGWTHNGVTVTANAVTGPTGEMTGNHVEHTSTGGSRAIAQTVVATAQRYVAAFWIRAAASTTAQLGIYQSSGGFQAVTGRTLHGPGALTGTNLLSLSGLSPTQWSRIQVVLDGNASAANIQFYCYPGSAGSGVGDSVYLDNTVFGAGIYAPPDIITSGSTVTRSADVLGLIDPDLFAPVAGEGTLLWLGRMPYTAAQGAADVRLLTVSDGTGNDDAVGFLFDATNDDLRAVVSSGGGGQASIDLGQPAAGSLICAAMAFREDDVRAALNGTLGAADTSADAPLDFDRLRFDAGSGAEHFAVVLLDQALPDAELVALTSNPALLKTLAA